MFFEHFYVYLDGACEQEEAKHRVHQQMMEVEGDEFGYSLLPEGRKVSAGSDQKDRADQGNQHDADGKGKFEIPEVDIGENRSEDNEETEQAVEFTGHDNFFTM